MDMPSVLANTFTDPSQEYTLFFQKRKIRDFAGPVGTPPKSPYESHVWLVAVEAGGSRGCSEESA